MSHVQSFLIWKLWYIGIYINNNQINAHAVIGQSAVGYCAVKPTEKSHGFWIVINRQ